MTYLCLKKLACLQNTYSDDFNNRCVIDAKSDMNAGHYVHNDKSQGNSSKIALNRINGLKRKFGFIKYAKYIW